LIDVDTKVDTKNQEPHEHYTLSQKVTCSIPVSSLFLKNQQSCGLRPQNRMVADFLLLFIRFISLYFRLKNMNERHRCGHEVDTTTLRYMDFWKMLF
jgi:hypothetical protein